MKNSKVLKTILIISGLIAAGIGGAILFTPVAFHASSGIELGRNVSLFSEVRAPGGALMASGIVIMLGAFIAELTFSSIVISLMMYLSYGISRILSMLIDGMPDEGIVVAALVELVVGLVSIFALLKYRENEV